MSRLDEGRQIRLEPLRKEKSVEQIHLLGFECIAANKEARSISFEFKGHTVTYYPYTGWATGKSIKDGRGLKNLLKQLTK
jgi:hypothetical protein